MKLGPSFPTSRFSFLLRDEMKKLVRRGLIYGFEIRRDTHSTFATVFVIGDIGVAKELDYGISDLEVENLRLSLNEIAAFVSLKLVEKLQTKEGRDV